MRPTADRHQNHPKTAETAVYDLCMTIATHPARIAAQASGAVHFHGPPCPKHPESPRFTSSTGCVACGRERSREAARRLSAAIEPIRAARREARERLRALKAARPTLADHPARIAALEAGERYFQGPPCRWGHDGRRYAVSGACVECRRAANVR